MASPQIEHGFFRTARELHMALCKTRIPGEARQMWDTIFSQTFGFQKKKAEIPTAQIMEITGMTRLSVYRARKKLVDMNMITVYKNVDSQSLTYSIQKDYDKWKLSTKMKTVYKKETKRLHKSRQSVYKKADSLICKDSIKDIKDTSRATWLTPFARVWHEFMGGEIAYGQAANYLRPLTKKFGEDNVLNNFRNYLSKANVQFATLSKFSQTYGSWSSSISTDRIGDAQSRQHAIEKAKRDTERRAVEAERAAKK